MTKNLDKDGLRSIVDNYQLFYVDLWGVVHNGISLHVEAIKALQEIIVNLQSDNNISVILCDHQARDLLACVDTAAIIHNGKVVAHGTPSSLIQNIDAKNVYFGDSFKIS